MARADYSINLSVLTLCKSITSLGAFRVLITVDIIIWLINSYKLWLITWFIFDLWYLELPTIVSCQILII